VAYWSDEFQRVQSPVLRYGLAVVSVAIVIAIGLALRAYQFRDVELPVLALTIGVVTWYAGTGPAALAVLLSTMAFDYLFVEPLYTFYVSASDLPLFGFCARGGHRCHVQCCSPSDRRKSSPCA
jgi:K+-sensing histidine kinase KdpD